MAIKNDIFKKKRALVNVKNGFPVKQILKNKLNQRRTTKSIGSTNKIDIQNFKGREI